MPPMPSKHTSLAIAIGSLAVFALSAYYHMGYLSWPALFGAVVFGVTWFVKFQRDRKLSIRAANSPFRARRDERRLGPPPKMSPDSGGLFVPDKHWSEPRP